MITTIYHYHHLMVLLIVIIISTIYFNKTLFNDLRLSCIKKKKKEKKKNFFINQFLKQCQQDEIIYLDITYIEYKSSTSIIFINIYKKFINSTILQQIFKLFKIIFIYCSHKILIRKKKKKGNI